MIRESKITTMSELKRRQKQLRLETEIAKREFAHSIGTTKENAGDFLVKKVALPAGGGLVGIIALSKLFSSKDRNKVPVIKETRVVHEYPDGTAYNGKKKRKSKAGIFKRLPILFQIVKVLIPIVQAVVGAFQTHKAKEAARTAKRTAVRS